MEVSISAGFVIRRWREMDKQKLSEYYDIFLEDIQKSADEKSKSGI